MSHVSDMLPPRRAQNLIPGSALFRICSPDILDGETAFGHPFPPFPANIRTPADGNLVPANSVTKGGWSVFNTGGVSYGVKSISVPKRIA